MAASYTWPVTLPQTPLAEYTENNGVLIIQTPMDAGPAKRRRRGELPTTFSCGFHMTSTQVGTLETFVKTTISGTARFYFTHPRTGSTVEVRIVPSDNGKLYTATYLKASTYLVSLNLEVMP